MTARRDREVRGTPLPKPPIKTMTDFVVFSFVSIVVFILFSAVIGILLTTIIRPNTDNSQTIAILADVTTSLISALVGFLAGKGTGHQEAAEHLEQIRQTEREFIAVAASRRPPTGSDRPQSTATGPTAEEA